MKLTIIEIVMIKNSMYKTLLRFTCENGLSNYRLLKYLQNVRRRLSLAVIM